MEWITTSTILHELRDFENETAWNGFVERFGEPVIRFVQGLGFPEADAEDVAQETLIAFAEAFRKGRYDRARGRLSSWLFGIAYKQSLRARGKGGRMEASLVKGEAADRAMAAIPDEKTAGDLWNTHWENFLTLECIRQIRREHRPESVRAFELVVKEGYSPQEAADEIGMPVKAVYNARYRILKRIRELRAALEETE